MNPSLRQLKSFMTLAHLGSFTRAAQQLHITQAGLSSMIRDLEQQLDSRLFDRTTRTVTLTAAGLALLPTVEAVVQQLEEASAHLHTVNGTGRSTLRVGATPIVASCVLPEVFERFAQSSPHVTLRVVDVERAGVARHVEDGSIDVGFGAFLSAAAGLQRELVTTLGFYLVSPLSKEGVSSRGGASRPPRSPASRDVERTGLEATPRSWSSLQGLELVTLPADNPVQKLIDGQLAQWGMATTGRHEFRHFHTLMAMVEAGVGHAVVPSFVWHSRLRYRVRLQPLVSPALTLDFYQISKRGRVAHPAAQNLTECMKSVLDEGIFLHPLQARASRNKVSGR
jgi:DNA-binding transcriptional LysR family regulator